MLFEGFERGRRQIGDIGVNHVIGGQGPALLLLHGYPQNLSQWAKIAPLLARDFTVVCPDLRGYGDSSKPRNAADNSTYSFRAMAADQVGLMRALGLERFHVAGHDRGGRVAHRMALDWPDEVRSLAVLDVVPTYKMYMETNKRVAGRYWQWYFLPLPEPFPERMIGGNVDYYFENCLVSNGGVGLDAYDAEMLAEYRRCWRDPDMIHASCSDYRAGSTIDLEHDAADLKTRLRCPVLALWGGNGLLCQLFDVEAAWRERCAAVRGESVPGGHFFPEQLPEETVAVLKNFLAF